MATSKKKNKKKKKQKPPMLKPGRRTEKATHAKSAKRHLRIGKRRTSILPSRTRPTCV
jgi:hypothetical protein